MANDSDQEGQRVSYRRRLVIPAVVLANIVAWAIPSDTTHLVAKNTDVLLGRYSVERLTFLLFLPPISVAAAYLLRANKTNRKLRHFQVLAATLGVILSVLAVDALARLREPNAYVYARTYFNRPPNSCSSGIAQDAPHSAYAYPTYAPGYPDINYTYTADDRGFRNSSSATGYDLVCVGDSFTEGCFVSDDQAWPALLEQRSNMQVYNLGMTGGHPGTYLGALCEFVADLKPKTIVCMFYEGNDFSDSNAERRDRLGRRIELYVRSSPIRKHLEALMIRHLGTPGGIAASKHKDSEQPSAAELSQPLPSPAPSAGTQTPLALSWLPVRMPDGPEGPYYTLKVQGLAERLVPPEQFLRSRGWKFASEKLLAIKALCDKQGIRLILTYAPGRARTLVPLLTGRVTPEQLHAFLALEIRRLPPPSELMQVISARLDTQEDAIEALCRENSIEFVSLIDPLRAAIAEGRQAYFTYDRHWTPVGHEIAAGVIAEYLRANPE